MKKFILALLFVTFANTASAQHAYIYGSVENEWGWQVGNYSFNATVSVYRAEPGSYLNQVYTSWLQYGYYYVSTDNYGNPLRCGRYLVIVESYGHEMDKQYINPCSTHELKHSLIAKDVQADLEVGDWNIPSSGGCLAGTLKLYNLRSKESQVKVQITIRRPGTITRSTHFTVEQTLTLPEQMSEKPAEHKLCIKIEAGAPDGEYYSAEVRVSHLTDLMAEYGTGWLYAYKGVTSWNYIY